VNKQKENIYKTLEHYNTLHVPETQKVKENKLKNIKTVKLDKKTL